MMLYTRKQMEREIDRRLHEESMWREVWERLDRQQRQIEELRFMVECMKHPGEKTCVKDEMAVIDNVLFRFWQMGWLPPVPHGRLIDADVLTELCRDMQSIEWNKHAAPYSWAYAYEDFENVILDAPTIIPAEKEEEHG